MVYPCATIRLMNTDTDPKLPTPDATATTQLRANQAALNANPEDGADVDFLAGLGPGQRATWARQSAFLAAYIQVGTVLSSAEAIGSPRQTVEYWQKHDVLGFVARFDKAQQGFRETLERIATGRVFAQKPNDNPLLLITLLNANWPNKYRPASATTDDAAKELMAELRKRDRAQRRKPQPQREVDGEREAQG